MGIYFDETLCTLLDIPDLPEGFGVLLFDGFVYPALHDGKGWRSFNRGSGVEECPDTQEGRAEAAEVCRKEAEDKKARTMWKPFFYDGNTSNKIFSGAEEVKELSMSEEKLILSLTDLDTARKSSPIQAAMKFVGGQICIVRYDEATKSGFYDLYDLTLNLRLYLRGHGEIGPDEYVNFANYADIKRHIDAVGINRNTGWFPVMEVAK